MQKHDDDTIAELCPYRVAVGSLACICHIQSREMTYPLTLRTIPSNYIDKIPEFIEKCKAKSNGLRSSSYASVPPSLNVGWHDQCTSMCRQGYHVPPARILNCHLRAAVCPKYIITVIERDANKNKNKNTKNHVMLQRDIIYLIFGNLGIEDSFVCSGVCSTWYLACHKISCGETTFDESRWFRPFKSTVPDLPFIRWNSPQHLCHAWITLFYRLYPRIKIGQIKRFVLHPEHCGTLYAFHGNHNVYLAMIERFPALTEMRIDYYSKNDRLDLRSINATSSRLTSLIINTYYSVSFWDQSTPTTATSPVYPYVTKLTLGDHFPDAQNIPVRIKYLRICYKYMPADASSSKRLQLLNLPNLRTLIFEGNGYIPASFVNRPTNPVVWSSRLLERLELDNIIPLDLDAILSVSTSVKHLKFKMLSVPEIIDGPGEAFHHFSSKSQWIRLLPRLESLVLSVPPPPINLQTTSDHSPYHLLFTTLAAATQLNTLSIHCPVALDVPLITTLVRLRSLTYNASPSDSVLSTAGQWQSFMDVASFAPI